MNVGWMRVANIVKVGLQSIARNKLRSALTMLGIVIGVACVIAMVAVASGASSSIQAQIDALGSNFLMIFPGTTTSSGARMFSGSSTLTVEDAAAIRADCPSIAYVSATARTSAQVVAGELNWATQIQGVDVDFPFIRAWNVSEGDFFTDADVRSATKVAVLGRTVADALFPAGGATGSTIRIKNVPFRVVGVLEKKGGSTMGQDQDDAIVAPYTTVMKRLEGRSRVGMILAAAVVARSAWRTRRARSTCLLRQRHRIGPGTGRRLHDPLAGGDGLDRRRELEDAVGAARLGGGDLAPGRRHRDHEHHAGLGHRAHARDRHPHGDRRQGPPRPGAVPARGGGALGGRRPHRDPPGRRGLGAHRALRRLAGGARPRPDLSWPSASPPSSASSSASIPRRRAAALDPIDALRFE
jgi:hypothetical protein